MAEASADRRKAAVQSLFRVRASESPPGPDGTRTVWHQGGEGADLTSTVDAQGRVTRQEFVLFGEQLLWVAESGASTGKIQDEKAAGQVKGSELVARDAKLDARVLSRMNLALAGYAGEDRYLRHLAKVVGNINAGLNDFEASEVTSSTMPGVKDDVPPPPAPAAPSKLPLVAGLVAAAIAIAIAVVMLIR
ncbi:MAG TPA: hypothetical protein VGK67_09545 [Myxococcales bacterium]|jgi:hypothetical protein